MSGWIGLALIGVVVAGALWVSGVSRALWTLVGAALMLGAAGYALQQRAGLGEHLAVSDAIPVAVAPEMIELRDAMLGRFTGDGAYLMASDALMRSGSRRSGVNVVLLGLNHYPLSLTLWTGLGTALVQHDASVSPAARLAFDQATRLAPEHPAPPFFEGLAYAQTGQYRTARLYWARALKLAPAAAGYHRDIALRLAALDLVIAQLN
ncbi:tetratricopeptide repeat protein [Sphingomonas sp. UYP23]